MKRACEDLISLCAAQATKPLRAFLDSCSTYLSSTTSADLASQSFATPEKIKKVHEQFKSSVKGDLENWIAELMRYLQDGETVRVLVPPAQVSTIIDPDRRDAADYQNKIVDEYRRFHDLIRAEFDFSTAASIMTPSAVHSLLVRNTANGQA